MAEKKVVSWQEFGEMAERLAELIKGGGRRYGLVVGVLRGGGPLALIVADRLMARVDFINVKSYTGVGTRSEPRVLSTITEDAEGKDVLVVDDLVDEGTTMEFVARFLKEHHGTRAVETSALFVKPWSKLTPNYYLGTTDEWVVFPWELCEFGIEECGKAIR